MKIAGAVGRRTDATSQRARLIRTLGLRHSARRWRLDQKLEQLAPARRIVFDREMWSEAAVLSNATIAELAPRLFQFGRHGVLVRVAGQRTPFADPVSIELASAKDLSYRLLAAAGVRIPDHVAVSRDDPGPAFEFLASGSVPCVVKPARGGGAGQGVTTSVVTSSQLARGLRRAGLTSAKLLIEREVVGEHYRFLLLDGAVLDVVERGRPRVIGDGASTIEGLMFAEYERRLADPGPGGWKPFPVDLDCLFALRMQGHGLTSVPESGEIVVVKGATNISGAHECATYTGVTSPDVIAEVRTAAAAVGVRLAGVDVVATSIAVPFESSNGRVLEVNPIPGLFHHYNVADPAAARPVAAPILEALLTRHAGSSAFVSSATFAA